jgi:formylglycine-generating enzyme required for sulfatase activity
MKRSRERARLEERVTELLAAGVRPVVAEVVNSIGMRLALIPPGRFRMGSPSGEAGRGKEEGPLHEVEITQAFYLGVFAVTQAQWQAVMGNNPSHFCATGGGKEKVKRLDTTDFPVEQVSWEDAQAFLQRLSALPQEKDKGLQYRLPSEAEWEYCCRGGACSSTAFHFGAFLSSTQANFNGNYPYGGAEKGPWLVRTCRVGSYTPNALGLHDTHGNVWEWCEDWYDKNYDTCRVLRGGGWNDGGVACRAAFRIGRGPSNRLNYLGFRVAAVPPG